MTIDSILIQDTYIIVIGISVLFSLLAIFRRTVLTDLLATICWWVGGATHLLASPTSTPLYSISFLYWGFGLIFFALVWVDLLQLFDTRKSNKGVGPI